LSKLFKGKAKGDLSVLGASRFILIHLFLSHWTTCLSPARWSNVRNSDKVRDWNFVRGSEFESQQSARTLREVPVDDQILTSLKKLDGPVLGFRCFVFCSFRMKIKGVENTRKFEV
jgi:hypothetical protein